MVTGIPRESDDDVTVTLVSFSDSATRVFSLGFFTSDADVTTPILNTPYQGGEGSDLQEAFRVARTECYSDANDREGVRNVAVLISPGVQPSQARRDSALTAAWEFKNTAGVTLLTIGVTDVIDPTFLRMLASDLGSNQQTSFMSTDFTALTGVHDVINQCDMQENGR